MSISALAFPEPWEEACEQLGNHEYCLLDEIDGKTQEVVFVVLQKTFKSNNKHCFKSQSARDNYINSNLSNFTLKVIKGD